MTRPTTEARPIIRHRAVGPEANEALVLATRYRLTPVRQRTPFGQYLRELVERRHFTWELTAAQMRASNSQERLGSLWYVLTPILLGSVYYLVFGVLLGAGKGVPSYLGFLTCGIFLWQYTLRSITNGSRAMSSNVALVRSMHFPRAILPISSSLRQALTVLPAIGVMLLLVLVTTGLHTASWRWLLVLPSIALQGIFNLGLALIFARMAANISDISLALPFVLRAWMYFSGVFYSISRFQNHPAAYALLRANPLHIYMTLVRDSVLYRGGLSPGIWVAAAGYAIAAATIGLLVFWQGEEQYGRAY